MNDLQADRPFTAEGTQAMFGIESNATNTTPTTPTIARPDLLSMPPQFAAPVSPTSLMRIRGSTTAKTTYALDSQLRDGAESL